MKKVFSMLLVIIMLFLCVACTNEVKTNELTTEESEYTETNVEKIEHKKEVPEGYIGIYNSDDLINSGLNTNANYILMNDIEMSQINDWTPIDNFSIFDGNNYAIYDLTSTQGGLFNKSDTVINLNLLYVDISLKKTKSVNNGIIANESNYVYNCKTTGNYSLNLEDYLDGGWTIGTRMYCVGGIVGFVKNGMIENCINESDIVFSLSTDYDCYSCLGGITGTVNSISKCDNYGNLTLISQSKAYVGGVVGAFCPDKKEMESKVCYIDGCSSYSTISCNNNAGGIIGNISCGWSSSSCSVSNCKNEGDIYGCNNNEDAAGGIVGELRASAMSIDVHNCFNTGNISNVNNRGAIIGNLKNSDNLSLNNCCFINSNINTANTNAMFYNCISLDEEKLKKKKNLPFDNLDEWQNSNTFPKYIGTIN